MTQPTSTGIHLLRRMLLPEAGIATLNSCSAQRATVVGSGSAMDSIHITDVAEGSYSCIISVPAYIQTPEEREVNMRYTGLVLALFLFMSSNLFSQTIQDRLRTLEAQVAELQKQIADLRRETATVEAGQETRSAQESPTKATNREFSEQIHVPDLGGDEREHKLEGKPEMTRNLPSIAILQESRAGGRSA